MRQYDADERRRLPEERQHRHPGGEGACRGSRATRTTVSPEPQAPTVSSAPASPGQAAPRTRTERLSTSPREPQRPQDADLLAALVRGDGEHHPHEHHRQPPDDPQHGEERPQHRPPSAGARPGRGPASPADDARHLFEDADGHLVGIRVEPALSMIAEMLPASPGAARRRAPERATISPAAWKVTKMV